MNACHDIKLPSFYPGGIHRIMLASARRYDEKSRFYGNKDLNLEMLLGCRGCQRPVKRPPRYLEQLRNLWGAFPLL